MPSYNFAAWIADPANRVAVVGASGWIGQAVVDQVLAAAPEIAQDRLRLFGGGAKSLQIRGRALRTEPLAEAADLARGAWLIVHAGVVGIDQPDARARNDAILAQVLALADPVDGPLVMISSGAAKAEALGRAVTPYAEMKRDHETRVTQWAAANGRRLLVPRVFNLGGPYMTSVRNYALGDFILALGEQGRLDIGSAAPVFRSYVHVLELAGVVLDLAVNEESDPAPFDIGGQEIIELGALARLVASRLGLGETLINRPSPSAGPGDWYVGDARRYQTELFNLGRTPLSMPQIVDDTIADLRPSGMISQG